MMWDDVSSWQMMDRGPGWGAALALLLLVLLVVVPVVVLVTRQLVGAPRTGDRSSRLLRERLARGEISEAEFLALRDALLER